MAVPVVIFITLPNLFAAIVSLKDVYGESAIEPPPPSPLVQKRLGVDESKLMPGLNKQQYIQIVIH